MIRTYGGLELEAASSQGVQHPERPSTLGGRMVVAKWSRGWFVVYRVHRYMKPSCSRIRDLGILRAAYNPGEAHASEQKDWSLRSMFTVTTTWISLSIVYVRWCKILVFLGLIRSLTMLCNLYWVNNNCIRSLTLSNKGKKCFAAPLRGATSPAGPALAPPLPDWPRWNLNSCFGLFRTSWVHLVLLFCLTKLRAKQAKVVQKFVPWSRVGIFFKRTLPIHPIGP